MLCAKPATLLKVKLLHGCFSHFLNFANGTKSRKASHIVKDPEKDPEKCAKTDYAAYRFLSIFHV